VLKHNDPRAPRRDTKASEKSLCLGRLRDYRADRAAADASERIRFQSGRAMKARWNNGLSARPPNTLTSKPGVAAKRLHHLNMPQFLDFLTSSPTLRPTLEDSQATPASTDD
jgi:hypothetical protein